MASIDDANTSARLKVRRFRSRRSTSSSAELGSGCGYGKRPTCAWTSTIGNAGRGGGSAFDSSARDERPIKRSALPLKMAARCESEMLANQTAFKAHWSGRVGVSEPKSTRSLPTSRTMSSTAPTVARRLVSAYK